MAFVPESTFSKKSEMLEITWLELQLGSDVWPGDGSDENTYKVTSEILDLVGFIDHRVRYIHRGRYIYRGRYISFYSLILTLQGLIKIVCPRGNIL